MGRDEQLRAANDANLMLCPTLFDEHLVVAIEDGDLERGTPGVFALIALQVRATIGFPAYRGYGSSS